MSNLTFTIRLAHLKDLDQLWPMVRRAVAKMNADGNEQWGPDYPTRDIYAADIAQGELWVAERPHGLCATALLTFAPEVSYDGIPWMVPAPALVIHRLAVDPDLQRSGVGSALFRHAEGLARERGIPTIHIDTYGKNQAMQALILSQGFVRRGEIHLHGRPLPYPCFEKALL